MTDIEVVRKCLANCHSHALGFKRAGLMWMVKETDEAIAALERIAQPSFLSEYPRSDPPPKEVES